jgi:hypothetical protein
MKHGAGPMQRTMDKWAAVFAKLGPRGMDCMLEEPYGWEAHIRDRQ